MDKRVPEPERGGGELVGDPGGAGGVVAGVKAALGLQAEAEGIGEFRPKDAGEELRVGDVLRCCRQYFPENNNSKFNYISLCIFKLKEKNVC